ncbi:aminoglycoside phosphotransferase family protein [Ruania albidiflava]|uniref:aminoglycoside phosphotransferase family protein n=1 Tax=Ruania albidiflava TaxID=366586 RepID=UPI0003B3C125|nr:aminoglycoside phosphotransferase family protein [Ruania albidiflava]
MLPPSPHPETGPTDAVTLPRSLLEGVGATAPGAAWIQRLPQLVQRAQQRWQLQLAEPFGVGTASWTAPGRLPDGTPVVVKISYPHDEARHEAAALRAWHGWAAVELLDHHHEDWALLLRRAHPGTPLLHDTSAADLRLGHGLEVLRNLHQADITDAPMAHLTTVSAHWAPLAAARADRWATMLSGGERLVRAGLDLLHAFGTPGARPGPVVLLHGDLNPGNLILDAPTQGAGHWLAIDPKPMIGDPAYDLWPLLAQVDQPFTAADPLALVHHRVQLASQVLQIPALRICEWALARTIEALLWQLDTFTDPARQAAALGDLHQAQVWYHLAYG